MDTKKLVAVYEGGGRGQGYINYLHTIQVLHSYNTVNLPLINRKQMQSIKNLESQIQQSH